MKIEFQKIEENYNKIKKRFQEGEDFLLAEEISKEIKEDGFEGVFKFLVETFKGELRRDEKTPLVFHSIYLTRLLSFFGEDKYTLLIAALHDILEDSKITEKELINKNFLKNKEIINDLKILKENKSLSREPDGKTLPKRYKEHIKRIIGARKEIINVEIADRFCDLMDLEYILELPAEQKELRLKSKLIKTKSFVENITRNRKDINKDILGLFNYKIKKIEERWGLNINGTFL